jgi:uroporphyrinogen decarboxylase
MIDKLPADTVVMGNIDPAGVLCFGTPESVRKETQELLESCAKYPNFIVSSGCDIPPKTPWENVEAFFDTVEKFYR